MWWPAIGGLAVGVGGVFEPRALGVGYDVIGDLLNGRLLGMALVGLLIAKVLMWGVALGSGTSGGVLAPLLMIGGMVGVLEAHWIPVGDPGLWAAVSMAAVMGGTMRAPLTATVFALELSHDLNVLPEIFVGTIAALGVTVLLMKRSILTEKLARRGYHIMREYSVDPFDAVRVGEVMDTKVSTYPASNKVADLVHALGERNPDVMRHHAIPLVDGDQNLVGLITRGDVLRALDDKAGSKMTVAAAGSSSPIVIHADELVQDAVALMLRHNVGRLLVVDRDNPKRLIGYLGRPGILKARLARHEEEHLREPGFLTPS